MTSSKILILVITILLLGGCSKTTAVSSPNVVISVSPSMALTRKEFMENLRYPNIPKAWRPADESKIAMEKFDSLDSSSTSVIGFYREGYSKGDVFLLILWEPWDSDPMEQIKFSFRRQYSMKKFELEDWHVFSEWYFEVIPSFFDEDVEVDIVRHPEVFTDPQFLDFFYKESGFPR